MIYGFILKEKQITHLYTKFGSERIIVNNVLLLEINSMGLLETKEFLDLTKYARIEICRTNH